jgi:L-methionine (R)-S-oxide reductase
MQVHADASNFASNVTKEEAYKQVLEAAELLFEDQRNWVRSRSYSCLSNSANSSQVWYASPSIPCPHLITWPPS